MSCATDRSKVPLVGTEQGARAGIVQGAPISVDRCDGYRSYIVCCILPEDHRPSFSFASPTVSSCFASPTYTSASIQSLQAPSDPTMFAKLVLVAALAVSAGAHDQHQARQAPPTTTGPKCKSLLASYFVGHPSPVPDLVSYLDGHSITNPCTATGVPPSIISEYFQYQASVDSYYQSHLPELSSNCPGYTEPFTSGPTACTNSPTMGAAGGGAASATGTGSGGATGSKNIGPRETGAIGAAIAAAGMIGAALL